MKNFKIGDKLTRFPLIQGGMGVGISDYEVTVDFEKAGVKKMFASFAKLKKVE